MLWLQRPPLVKWIAVGLISCVALWLEIRPDPMVDHPFATAEIAPGEAIGPQNTDLERVPSDLFDPPSSGQVALRRIPAGSPIMSSVVGEPQAVIPEGWWTVAMEVPPGAAVGDRVRVVVLDTVETVEGIVTSVTSDDPFASLRGGVAVEAARASEVAVAAANGRVSVLVSTG